MTKLTDTAQRPNFVEQTSSVVPSEIVSLYAEPLIAGMNSAFDAIDDTLFDLANNARNNNEQNRYFEAMRELRLKRRSTLKTLHSSIKDECFNPVTESTNEASAETDELSLVNSETLEKSLALDAMSSKADIATKEISFTLNQRLAATLAADDLTHFVSPTTPVRLSKHIETSCQDLDIELPELLLFYKHIDKHVFSKLPDMHAELDQKLKDAGVLPDLSYQAVIKSAQSRNKQDSAHASSNDNPKVCEPTTHSQTEAYNELTGPQQNALPVANQSDILEALNLIHSALGSLKATGRILHQTITEQLEALLASERSKKVSQEHLDLINLVAMLFEYIMDDENLHPVMQTQIGRLQIPVLKAVLVSPNFFQDTQHPARNFLNRTASAVIGWTAPEENSKASTANQRLHDELNQIISRIISQQDINAFTFEEADIRLRQFLALEEKRQKLLELRTRQTEEGRVKTRIAHTHVDNTIKALVSSSQNLPPSVVSLLTGPWKKVLFISFLRDGHTLVWESRKRASESLVWCCLNYKTKADRQKWVTIAPSVINEISKELRSHSLESKTTIKLIKQVRHDLASRFREGALSNQGSPSSNTARHATNVATTDKQDQVTAIDMQKRESQKTAHIDEKRDLGLSMGQWVEIRQGNLAANRYKLVSHIPDLDTYIFVDRSGLNPIHMSYRQIHDRLNDQTVKILDKNSMIDRALSTIATNFNR